MENIVKGYKVFNPDWTCRDKQYTCPGTFEETGDISVCSKGMHFCKKAADCFNYYDFDPNNHVAEVIAHGGVLEDGDKCCTDKLEVVREIPWTEVLEVANTGRGCSGIGNSGNENRGHWNAGCRNSGNRNSGNENTGDWNTGIQNAGDWNTGNCNTGYRNTGGWNTGYRNSGDCNTGSCNSGDWNTGAHNTGIRNSGNWNTGSWNSGNGNSGDWNSCDSSSGCFNTTTPKIYLFNKPSEWTYRDWLKSEAYTLFERLDCDTLDLVPFEVMSEEEKAAHPEAETIGVYLKELDKSERVLSWWRGLNKEEKAIIKAIPNFDPAIFKQTTGIDVEVEP